MLWLVLPSEELIIIWWGSDPRYGFRIIFSVFTIAEYGILDLLAFVTQSPANFHDTRRNDWRRRGTNPQHFGSDLTSNSD